MKESGRLPRTLVIVGFVGMLLGLVDPLEGSIVILAGSALVLIGALLGRSRHRKLISWAFALVAIGVGLMWGMSAIGGIGGSTGRSMWWALVLLPYPVGWVMGFVGVIRALRETNAMPAPA
jgi:hypothetical protein